MPPGQVHAATHTSGPLAGANVPAHEPSLSIGAQHAHVVVTDGLILDIGSVGDTVLGARSVTRL